MASRTFEILWGSGVVLVFAVGVSLANPVYAVAAIGMSLGLGFGLLLNALQVGLSFPPAPVEAGSPGPEPATGVPVDRFVEFTRIRSASDPASDVRVAIRLVSVSAVWESINGLKEGQPPYVVVRLEDASDLPIRDSYDEVVRLITGEVAGRPPEYVSIPLASRLSSSSRPRFVPHESEMFPAIK